MCGCRWMGRCGVVMMGVFDVVEDLVVCTDSEVGKLCHTFLCIYGRSY